MSTGSGRSGRLRSAIGTVVRGFLLGLGFSVALAGVYFVALQVTINKTRAAAMEDLGSVENSAVQNVNVSNVEEAKHDGVTLIIGSVKNAGKKPVRSVEVQADLFDHGKFVDKYSTYISGTIAPGESRNFKISCGCKDSPPAEHDSYKVEVVSGY